MKYQVKIGQEFPCYVAEEHSISVEVRVNQDVDLRLADARSQPTSHWKSMANTTVYGLGVLLAVCVLSSALLGWATGDFSVLKSIAESGRDLLALGVKLIPKS